MATFHLHVNLTCFVFQRRLACFRGSLKNKATDSLRSHNSLVWDYDFCFTNKKYFYKNSK